MTKVAVVTGSNKGIGLAIVRALCKQFDGDVFLTSRDVERGHAAVKLLEEEGLSPKFHQLDIEDGDSIVRIKEMLSTEYGGVDVLVNNAGVSYSMGDATPFGTQAERTFSINYYGTLNLCNALLPIVNTNGRVVHVSSTTSLWNLKKCSPELQAKFRSDTITLDELTAVMDDFVKHAKDGDYVKQGFGDSAYGMSKVGMTTMARIQARMYKDQNILVNACCPGLVSTDMTRRRWWVRLLLWVAPFAKNPDQGADTPVYLATLPTNSEESPHPNGEFVRDRNILEW